MKIIKLLMDLLQLLVMILLCSMGVIGLRIQNIYFLLTLILFAIAHYGYQIIIIIMDRKK